MCMRVFKSFRGSGCLKAFEVLPAHETLTPHHSPSTSYSAGGHNLRRAAAGSCSGERPFIPDGSQPFSSRRLLQVKEPTTAIFLPSVPAPTKPSSGDLLQRTPPANRGTNEPTTSPPSSLLLVLVATE